MPGAESHSGEDLGGAESRAHSRLLYDLGCAFSSRLELDELLPFVISECREAINATGASVLLVEPETNELYFPYVAEEDPEVAARLSKLRFPADRGIAGHVLRSGESLRVDDVQSDPRFYGGIDRDTGLTTRTILCVPLFTRQGTIGVLQVINRRDGLPFSAQDLALLEALAGSIAVAIENARLYARVKASEELLRAQVGALRRDLARRDHFGEIIGTSPSMAEVFRLMESAAASPIAVLIEGETGTGKELVARGIHRASSRGEGPLVAVNCAAVSETLLESELFGHRKGSFTGAMQDQRGLFEAANSGTIFLDEIGEMPPSMQAKLLRVVQEGEVVPVGDTRPRPVDVRVISATNCNLSEEVARQKFRQDLFYRIAAFPIALPPLRERREDIALLVDRILKMAAEQHGKRITGIESDAVNLLLAFAWPGNVRELENELERAVALAKEGEAISVRHLSAKLKVPGVPRTESPATPTFEPPLASVAPAATPVDHGGEATSDLREARAQFEASFLRQALERNDRNVSRTARAVGLSRVMLQKKMKEYGLR
jgi:Nif-specific regulatory protein